LEVALTSRGMKEDDFKTIAGFFKSAVVIAQNIQGKEKMLLKDFEEKLKESDEVKKLKEEVEKFSADPKFSIAGFFKSAVVIAQKIFRVKKKCF